MSLITLVNRWVIGYSPIRYTIFWNWYRLINHRGWRLDDRHLYYDFWHSLNHGWEHMDYVYRFEEFWGKGSYPPETITISQEDYDSLVEKLNEPPQYNEKIANLLTRKTPWDK